METVRRCFRINRYEINYLRITLESYDGMAVVRTLDPHSAVIEVMISPGCLGLVLELIDDLVENEGIDIVALDQKGNLGG